jgi:penicillin-binding protein 1B
MARRLPPSLRRPPRWVLVAVPVTLFLALLGLAAWVVVLERQVTSKWEGRKWSLPSRVYSDAYLVYPGRRLDAEDFEARLRRLGYLEQAGGVDDPGEYAREEGEWLVYLHAFHYPDGANPPLPIRIRMGGGRVSALTHARSRESLASAALEPEVIGVIFDQHMEDRTPVDLEEIPAHVVDAILAVEDSRF